jgi:hypothetical protein
MDQVITQSEVEQTTPIIAVSTPIAQELSTKTSREHIVSTSEDTPDPPHKRRTGRGGRNNLQHGLRAVVLGATPTGASYVGRLVQQLRMQLEDAVVDAKGEVSLADALAINTACRWERHSLLATRWLKQGFDKLTPDQRLNHSREVAKASESRDRAIRELRLDTDSQTIIGNLKRQMYGPVETSADDGLEAKRRESKHD